MTKKLGYAVHGGSVSVERVAALSERAGGYGVIKVLDDAGYLRNLASLIGKNTTLLYRSWGRGGWMSDNRNQWHDSFPDARDGAAAFYSYGPLQGDFGILRDLARQGYKVAIEFLNEQGGDKWHFETLAHLIDIAAQDNIGVAAVNYSVGSMNESSKWDGFALLGEALNTHPNSWCAGHSYGSYSTKWMDYEGSPAEFTAAINGGAQPSWYDMKIMPYDHTLQPRFLAGNITRAKYIHEQLGFKKIRYAYTEFGPLDNTGSVPGRPAYDGWLSWSRAGELRRMALPGESDIDVIARMMENWERQCQMWDFLDWYAVFVLNDVPNTRWRDNYRHEYGDLPEKTADRIRLINEAPEPEKSCVVKPVLTYTNIRSKPAVTAEKVGELRTSTEIIAYLPTDDPKWNLWYQLQDKNWVAAGATVRSGDCANLPLYKEEEMPEIELTSALGYVLPDTVSPIDIIEKANTWSPVGVRSMHAPGTTAEFRAQLQSSPYLWTRPWFQNIRDGQVDNPNSPVAIIDYCLNPIRDKELPVGGVPERIANEWLSSVNVDVLSGTAVLLESYNPPHLQNEYLDYYLRSEFFRLEKLQALDLHILGGNLLSTDITEITPALNTLLNAISLMGGAFGIRVVADRYGRIPDALRVRKLLNDNGHSDVGIILTSIDIADRASLSRTQLGEVMARLSSQIEATDGIYAGVVWSLGGPDDISDLIDVIKAGNTESVPDDNEPPDDEQPPDDEEPPDDNGQPDDDAETLVVEISFVDGSLHDFEIDADADPYYEILENGMLAFYDPVKDETYHANKDNMTILRIRHA